MDPQRARDAAAGRAVATGRSRGRGALTARSPTRDDITGLVLAGGRGARMEARDKGLESFDGMPLAARALLRLAPQVGSLMVSANRHRARYEAFGARVIGDADATFQGPLAGIAAALAACPSAWLAVVPCDAPFFPEDLVVRLATALAGNDGRRMAVACTATRSHPIFCLVEVGVADTLTAYLASGRRSVAGWAASLDALAVAFDDEEAFANLNTLDELRRAERSR